MSLSVLSQDTLTTHNAFVTNLSATYADIVNCSVLDLNYVTITNVSLMYYYGNVSAMNACMFITDITNASITNLLAASLSASNVDVVNSTFVNTKIQNLSSVNACITNISSTNASLETAIVTNCSVINASITNGSFFTVSITNAYLETLTVGGQAYGGNAGGSYVNASATYFDCTNASFNYVYTDKVKAVSSIQSLYAYLNNVCVTSASLGTTVGTNASIQTASFTNSFANVAVMSSCSVTNDTFIGASLNVCGNIYANHGFYTDFITVGYSDDQLKNRLNTLSDCVSRVESLNAFVYEPKEWACEKYGFVSRQRYGLSAQEVQTVFPNAVTTSAFDKTYLSLDYDMLVPVLVKCVQELNQRLKIVETHI